MLQYKKSTENFLSGGGEMGELMRSFDWSSTTLGPTNKWPISLQVILRLLLASKQPMFVWWGPDLRQFYNDSYREILGDKGKHPLALGQKAKDCWGTIWAFIHPLIEKVMQGEDSWEEDQLIPIFRNGLLDPVYWTFAYTPIRNDKGKINGVLVICNETTKKVLGHQQLLRQVNSLLLQAPIAIGTFYGKDLVIDSVNEKMLTLWGRNSKEEVIGIPLFEALPETANQGLKELVIHAYETGETYVTQEQEIKLLRNGKLKQFYLKVMYQPLRDENNMVVGIMELADDITDTVKKRKGIAENELISCMVIASAELGTYQVNLLTDEVSGNKQFYKLFNIKNTTKRENVINKLHPDDLLVSHKNHKTAMVSGKLCYEARIVHADSSLHWLKIYGKVIFDELKRPVKLLGVVDDITQQKTFEKEKNDFLAQQIIERNRLELFESVISHIKDGVVILAVAAEDTTTHKIIYCNDALTDISGHKKQEIVGKTIELFNGVKNNSIEWKSLKKAIDEKQACEVDVVSTKKNKGKFWNNMCISPVSDSDGNYTHCIAIIRDITLRKKNDKELTGAIIHAQEKDRFEIGAELHDNVNQILAGTLMNLGLVLNKVDEQQKIHLDKSIGHVHLAIKEIRRLSHWLAPVGLDEKTLVESFKKLLKDINVNNQFLIQFKSDKISDIVISSNIQLNLYRILQEQLTNILKYAQASIIDVTLEKGKDHICLSIRDNGIGLDTKKFKEGIGLNNIRKRVELLSGTFLLLSSVKNGCEIRVKIPFKGKEV